MIEAVPAIASVGETHTATIGMVGGPEQIVWWTLTAAYIGRRGWR